MKIIFTNDFLMHSPYAMGTYHNWLVNLINPIQKCATNIDIIELRNYSINGKIFDRNKFFELSNIFNVKESYYLYDINKINENSWNYFSEFADKDTFIIGFELGLELREKLTERGINYINFWIHSYKLFDDNAFMINTNNIEIFNKLLLYKIPKLKFETYATYWQAYIARQEFLEPIRPNFNLEENSVLFIGQTFKDKSVQKGEQYLNILDFKDKLKDLANSYSKIYYVPHPYATNTAEIDEYINSVDYVETIENIPTYYLLASEKIKKVISISSSVLFEAQYFNKEIEYLYQPLFNIDGDFSLNTFISILDDYFNPKFWSDILSPIMPTEKDVPNEQIITNTKNKIRNIVKYYWGYSHLDELKHTEKKT